MKEMNQGYITKVLCSGSGHGYGPLPKLSSYRYRQPGISDNRRGATTDEHPDSTAATTCPCLCR